MITLSHYFLDRPHTPEQEKDASDLLCRVGGLLTEYMRQTGSELDLNPHTGSLISGKTEGGFRLPDCAQGAAKSSHKEAKGVDVYDPANKIDEWITRNLLIQFNLYRESPKYTNGWCHLTTREPKSKCRSFLP